MFRESIDFNQRLSYKSIIFLNQTENQFKVFSAMHISQPLDEQLPFPIRKKLVACFSKFIPFNRWLGLDIVELDNARIKIKCSVKPEHIGYLSSGIVHGGVISGAIDATSGASVFLAIHKPMQVATLDLRIDHLKPPKPNQALFYEAHCYRVATQVAFVKCKVYENSPKDLIATSLSSFILTNNPKFLSELGLKKSQ